MTLRLKILGSWLPRLLLVMLLAAMLLLVFLAYLQPSFVLDLANRFVLC